MMYYYNSFSPFYIFGPIFMILFWGFVIYLIVFIINKNQSKNDAGRHHSIEILKERYAKGEITKEQFEEMKKDLLK